MASSPELSDDERIYSESPDPISIAHSIPQVFAAGMSDSKKKSSLLKVSPDLSPSSKESSPQISGLLTNQKPKYDDESPIKTEQSPELNSEDKFWQANDKDSELDLLKAELQ